MVAPVVLLIVPPLMMKAPAAAPRALTPLMFSPPALRVIPPVKVFAPESVHVPDPFLTTAIKVAEPS